MTEHRHPREIAAEIRSGREMPSSESLMCVLADFSDQIARLTAERDAAHKNAKQFERDWLEVVDLCNSARDERDAAIARAERAERVAAKGVAVVEDFMPNIALCVLQDFGRLNEFLIESRALVEACEGGRDGD